MKCPKCGHRLVRKADGKVKLRVPILVFDEDGGTCTTSCPGCKEEIRLPVTLDKAAIPDTPRLVLGNQRLTRSRPDP